MRLSPADLETVLLTTLEPDLATGLQELHEAPRPEQPEWEKFRTGRTVYALQRPRSLWEKLPVKVFDYRGFPEGPVHHAWDLLGDGSILCVSAPGYTEGVCALLVRSPSGKFASVQSSVAMFQTSLGTENVPMAGFNRQYQKKSLAWLTEVNRRNDCPAVLCGHDPEDTRTEI